MSVGENSLPTGTGSYAKKNHIKAISVHLTNYVQRDNMHHENNSISWDWKPTPSLFFHSGGQCAHLGNPANALEPFATATHDCTLIDLGQSQTLRLQTPASESQKRPHAVLRD